MPKKTRSIPSGGEGGDPARELELRGMAELEGRTVVEVEELAVYRFGDLRAAVPGRDAEQAGRRVQYALGRGGRGSRRLRPGCKGAETP